MTEKSADVKILCNLPKTFRGKVNFVFGINDEKIGEGFSDETVTLTLPLGTHEILVLVRDENLNSMTGTSSIAVCGDMSLKLKYSLFSKNVKLVENKRL